MDVKRNKAKEELNKIDLPWNNTSLIEQRKVYCRTRSLAVINVINMIFATIYDAFSQTDLRAG